MLNVKLIAYTPDPEKTISQGGIKGSGWAMEGNTIAQMYMDGLSEKYGFDYSTWNKASTRDKQFYTLLNN